MYDEKVLNDIRYLSTEYKTKWGEEPLLYLLPKSITQEKYVSVLERMIITGESALAAFDFLKDNPPPTRRVWYQCGYEDSEDKYKEVIEDMAHEIAQYRRPECYEIPEAVIQSIMKEFGAE